MATSLTYESLIADMRGYSERGREGDQIVIDQIPRLINLAERNIVADLKLQGYEATLASTLTVGQSIYAKPDRWRETVSMHIGACCDFEEFTLLRQRSYEHLRAFWPNGTLTGQPRFYAEHGPDHWLIVPTPDQAYPWQLKAYLQPKMLGEDNDTNWLTEDAPQLLLHRALFELYTFLRDSAGAAMHKGLYTEALQSLTRQDVKKIMDRAAERDAP